MDIPVRSFTVTFNGLAETLTSETRICPAHDPSKGGTHPETSLFEAIWDTGATKTAITKKVVETCHLKAIGMAEVHTAGGVVRTPVYLINVILRNGVGIPNLRVTEATIHGADVLIGMDIISQGDFAVTCQNGSTVFSFRIPSVACIDFVSEANQAQKPIRHDNTKPSRNAPCSCGSGKKHKKCCGQ